MPVTPFIPKLLPSHLLQARQPSSEKHLKGPALLQANDPFSALKRNGLKLLEIPKSVPQVYPPKTCSLEAELPLNHKVTTSCQTDTQNDEGGNNIEVQQVMPVIKHHASSLTDVSSVSESKSQPSSLVFIAEPRKGVKKRRGSRKRKQQNRQVTWDQREANSQQNESEEAKNKNEDKIPSPINVQITGISSSEVEPCPQFSKTNKIGQPSLRKPMFGKDSHRSYPIDIPLESLEVRRLNLQTGSQNNFPKIESKNPVMLQTDVSTQVDTDNIRGFVATDVQTVQTSSEEGSSLFSPDHSDKSVPVALTIQDDPAGRICKSPANMSPTELTVEQKNTHPSSADTNLPQKEDNEHTNVLNDQYYPPVLALNVTELPAPNQVTSSVCLLSSSSESLQDVGLSRIQPPATSNFPSSKSDSTCQATISKPDAEMSLPTEFSNVIPDISPGSKITNTQHLVPLKHVTSPLSPLSDHTSGDGSHTLSSLHLGFVDLRDRDVVVNSEVVGELATHTKAGTVKSVAMKRLRELEEQLNAIENTAKSVEGEFKASKQVGLNTYSIMYGVCSASMFCSICSALVQ